MITIPKGDKNTPLSITMNKDIIGLGYIQNLEACQFDRKKQYTFYGYTEKIIRFLTKESNRKIYLGLGLKYIAEAMVQLEELLGDRLDTSGYDIDWYDERYCIRHVGYRYIVIFRHYKNNVTFTYLEYSSQETLSMLTLSTLDKDKLPTPKIIQPDDLYNTFGRMKLCEDIYKIISEKMNYDIGSPLQYSVPTEFCGLIDANDINDALGTYIEDMKKLLPITVKDHILESPYDFYGTYEILSERSPLAMYGRAKYMESFSKVHSIYSTSPAMLVKLADLYVLCIVVDGEYFKKSVPSSYNAIIAGDDPFVTTVERFRRFLYILPQFIKTISYRHPLWFTFSILALCEGRSAAEEAMRVREERERKLIMGNRKFGE